MWQHADPAFHAVDMIGEIRYLIETTSVCQNNVGNFLTGKTHVRKLFDTNEHGAVQTCFDDLGRGSNFACLSSCTSLALPPRVCSVATLDAESRDIPDSVRIR